MLDTLALLNALNDCHASDDPIFSVIAAKNKVNRNTLRRRYYKSFESPTKTKPRPSCQLLNDQQTRSLLRRLDSLCARKFYPTPSILRNLAAELFGTRPGKSWAQKFIKRNPTYKCIVVKGMDKKRHNAEYRPIFESYFDLVCELQYCIMCTI